MGVHEKPTEEIYLPPTDEMPIHHDEETFRLPYIPPPPSLEEVRQQAVEEEDTETKWRNRTAIWFSVVWAVPVIALSATIGNWAVALACFLAFWTLPVAKLWAWAIKRPSSTGTIWREF